MIDWFNLAANALWILALAMGLSAAGIFYFLSTSERQPLGAGRQGGLRATLSAAGFLFCIGLALNSETNLQAGLWSVLAAAFVIQWLANRRAPA